MEQQLYYVESLPTHIQTSLIYYTSDGYKDINDKLRHNIVLNDTERSIIENIDEAFKYVPPLSSPIMVYRGIGETFNGTVSSHISTTVYLDIAKSFAKKYCCILKITIPSGTRVLPLETISEHGHEGEILLSRFGRLNLIHTYEYEGIKTYDMVYIPEESIEVARVESLNKLEIDLWTSRIINIILPEEIELFGSVELAVQSALDTSYRDVDIPKESIRQSIHILKNM